MSYIEKEKAIEKVSQIRLEVVGARAVGKTIFTEALRIYRDAVLKSLNEAPTSDVVKVRHGEWNDSIIGFCNVCMECGAIVERTAIKNNSGKLNYCPNCGAKMDGERSENGREL